MGNPILFIIDMVNDSFIHIAMIKKRAQLCASINDLLGFARKNNFTIMWVRQEFASDLSDAFLEMREENIKMYISGTQGSKLVEELVSAEGEYEIIKKRFSMFYGTNLDSLLNKLKPSKLILTGVNTHACIRVAAIDAYQRDYRTIIVEDCVYSPDIEHHQVSLNYLGRRIAQVMPLDEAKRKLTLELKQL